MTTTTVPEERSIERALSTAEAPNREGLWGEQMTQTGLREVVFRRPLPMQLIKQYAEAAARRASTRQLDDGSWFGEIEGFAGIWANEPSQKQVLDVLDEVVFEWVLLKIRDEDRDMPIIESLDLNEL